MDNFNKEQILYCQYCGKECKSLNSLKQHEIRCNDNPNKIKVIVKGHQNTWSTNRTFINKDGIHKFINKDELYIYLNNGWSLGLNNSYKEKISNSLKGKSTGKASTIEKELKRKKKISETMKKNPLAGGYRKGSGCGHEGWYKGIFCDSSWELAFLIYYLEHNLYIERCKEKRKYIFENIEHTYIPDFITNDGIIEIKGFKTKQSEAKRIQNPDIKYLYGNDIKYCLDYTINKYGNKFWEVLYENKEDELQRPAGLS